MESFEQAANQYQPMIHKIIHSLHIYKNVDEFYQTGLIALWEAQKSFDEKKGSFANYAYTSIKGRILNELAKHTREEERSVYTDADLWEMIPDEPDYLSFEKEFLRTYGQSLTEKESKWLIKACFLGYSVKEIAENENVSVSAVKQWRTSARKKLREEVERMK